MSDTIIASVLGGCFMMLAAVIAPQIARRQARKAEITHADVEREQTALDAWRSLADERKADQEEFRKERDKLRVRMDRLEEDLETMKRHIRDLEEQTAKDKKWRALALRYIRTLRELIVSTGLPAPEPPSGLSLDDAAPINS